MTTWLGLLWRSTTAAALAVALAGFGGIAAAQSAPAAAQEPGEASVPANDAAQAPSAHPDGAQPAASTSSTTANSAIDSSATSDKAASAADAEAGSPASSYTVKTALRTSEGAGHTGDPNFDRASDSFPAFCKDWQRRLHDRELNNLENITWKDENGWKTGTYTAYSPIKSCNCKHSTGGVPIGELTYQETEEYLAGRTVEEARHAQPKAVGITNTTEIFRWDKTKWDDGR